MLLAAAGISATGLIACSVLIDRSAKQCTSQADCTGKWANSTCSDHGICVFATIPVGACLDAAPKEPDDFLNACTSSMCVHFDNCAHMLCDNPDAPSIPPDGGAPTADAGTTAAADAGTVQLPSCANPTDRPNVIYITGSSNFPPLLTQLGPFIMKQTGYTPVYQITSSCNGVKSVFSSTAKDHLMTDPGPGAKTAGATYVTADGALVPCALGAGGVTVDIGESDIFSSSCNGFDEPSGNVAQYYGPIQAMAFVVPSGSSQVVISAEMARAVFGRGGDDGKGSPWTEPKLYFVRNANTGTQQMIGRAIGVSADQFWGVDRGTAASVASQMTGVDPALAENAIGIISTDYYDRSNGNLRELAFQASGQSCGYWPDSTRFVNDKRNVRDGHYPIWGPLHFFTITSNGLPVSLAAEKFVETVSVDDPGIELLDAYVDAGLVPSCAMKVQRKRDLGPPMPSPPGPQCGCYFENRLAHGVAPEGCQPCTSPNECADPALPACRLGFCEAG